MEKPSAIPQRLLPVSRRELLKALAASGGSLLAAAILPGKWALPLVETGVLPAHAQGSCTIPVELVRPISSCDGCPHGNVANLSYPANGSPPTGSDVYYDNVWVPSTLIVNGPPGFFYVYFAMPATPPPSNIVEFVIHFDNGCTGTVSGPYK